MTQKESLKPSLAVLCKVGSIVVHADEMLSQDGREIDKIELQKLLDDPEVVAWIKAMGPLVPVKRVNRGMAADRDG